MTEPPGRISEKDSNTCYGDKGTYRLQRGRWVLVVPIEKNQVHPVSASKRSEGGDSRAIQPD
jgi:hypothetical protein